MKTISAILLASSVAIGSFGAATAAGNYSEIPEIQKTVTIGGKTAIIKVNPSFNLSGGENLVKLGVKADIDASDLQTQLPASLNGFHQNDRCGTTFRVFNTSFGPAGNGKASVTASFQAKQHTCKTVTYIKCKKRDKWYKLPKCGKAKKEIRARLISQSATFSALVWPSVNGNFAQANVQVTNASPSGLLGKIVKAFGLKGRLKKVLQKEINKALNEKGRIALPLEFQKFNVALKQAEFVDLGGGKLGFRLHATGQITQLQVAELIADKIAN